MKNTFIIICLLMACGAVNDIAAQTGKKGIIVYQCQSVASMNMGGQTRTQKMGLDIRLLYSEAHCKLEASLQMNVATTGNVKFNGDMFQYYDPSDKSFYQVQSLGGKNYAIKNEIHQMKNIVETGKTETILGYVCREFTCTYKNEKATGWYSEKLPSKFSPIGPQDVSGTILKFISPVYEFTAVEVSTDKDLKESDLKLPGNVQKTTREQMMRDINGK